MLIGAHAVTRVAERDGELIGHVLVLFNQATRVARLYSIAVLGAYRGQGIARRLVACAEREATARGRNTMRLEVRGDNMASLSLFKSLGYLCIGTRMDYYEDHMCAVRLEKHLAVDAFRERGSGVKPKHS